MWSSRKAEEDLEKLAAHAEEEHLYVDVVARTDVDGCTVHEQLFFPARQVFENIEQSLRQCMGMESNTQG